MIVEWSEEKNKILKKERKIWFEDVLVCIECWNILYSWKHYNISKYPNQNIFIVNIEGYAYVIPFIIDKNKIFLKTIYPSRVFTKKFNLK